MVRFLTTATFIATFLVAPSSSITSSETRHQILPIPATADVAASTSPNDTLSRAQATAARQSFNLLPQTLRYTVDRGTLSVLRLKIHRGGARVAAAGHMKFGHASNAPPVLLC